MGSAIEHAVPPGAWVDVARRAVSDDAIAMLARHPVVLLGEKHDRADHHVWQLDTLAALHARRPTLSLGFEMFPRRVQPVLDRWSAGELDQAEFLRQAEWSRVWGMDAALYQPLFDFARRQRLPMIALNVDRATARRVAQGDATPAEREGVGVAAPARDAYRARLAQIFSMHPRMGAAPDTERFERFLRGQLFWDRAMAEAIAASRTAPQTLVVAILGRGHVEYGDGVPHQLAALGAADVGTALPWDPGTDYPDGIADFLFGLTEDDPKSRHHGG